MLSPRENELTTQEAASLLCISRHSLLNLMDENVLPYKKVGIRRRVLISDINEYLKHQRVRRIELVR
jgi:excisionase family DNA binding protein